MNTEMSVNEMAMMYLMTEMMSDSPVSSDANGQVPFSPMQSGQGSWMTDASDTFDSGAQGVPDPERFVQELDILSTIFGPEAVESVTQQLFTERLAEGFADMVGDMGMPPVAQDATCECLRENARGGAGVNSDSDVGQAIESVLGDDIDSVVDMVLENVRDEMADETKRAFSSSGTDGGAGGRGGNSANGAGQGGNAGGGHGDHATGGDHSSHGASGDHSSHGAGGDHSSHEAGGDHSSHEASGDHAGHETSDGGASEVSETSGGSDVDTDMGGGSGGGGGGNWLVVLASALGKQTGKHLKEMVQKADELGAMDSEENPEAYAEINSELQAHAQMFKMASEALNTSLKSIGEGMSSISRKS